MLKKAREERERNRQKRLAAKGYSGSWNQQEQQASTTIASDKPKHHDQKNETKKETKKETRKEKKKKETQKTRRVKPLFILEEDEKPSKVEEIHKPSISSRQQQRVRRSSSVPDIQQLVLKETISLALFSSKSIQ